MVLNAAIHRSSARGVPIHDQCGIAGGTIREKLDCNTEGAWSNEAGVGREIDRWVNDARLLTLFVEKEGECSEFTCKLPKREMVQENAEGKDESGGYGE